MKICLRERCPKIEINEGHSASCWMNVKAAADAGEPVFDDGEVTEEKKGEA
jgi:hypothetical protein